MIRFDEVESDRHRTTLPGLPSERDVIALREVVGMPHRSAPPSLRTRRPPPAIPETCPPGEGSEHFRSSVTVRVNAER